MEYKKILIIQIIALCLLAYWWAMLVLPSLNSNEGTNVLKIHFLDVGQGDSILIETPDRRNVIIDAGRGIKAIDRVDSILPPTEKIIDVVVLTHPDSDHIGGFVSILKKYDTKTIIKSFITSETNIYEKVEDEIEKEIKENNAEVYEISRAYSFSVGEVDFDIIWPLGTDVRDKNSASVILLVTYGDIKTLLTGDASLLIEEEIVSVFGDLIYDVDILKAGHHGSNTSTSTEFLNHTKPNAIIFSAGEKNSYGHPHHDVVSRIDEYGKRFPEENIKTYATKDGDVSFCISKESFDICK